MLYMLIYKYNLEKRGKAMSNILDYLNWRGDLSFKQDKINEVDSIILARFSYLPFKDIKLESVDTIEHIADKLKHVSIDKFIWKDDKQFIEVLGKTNRYKDLIVSDYEEILDVQAQKQFSAITIWLPNRYKYISFRGTDMSLVGWKEDFNMSFLKDIPSQKEAVKYLDKIGRKYRDKLIIGGHSKGGNLAIYSAMHCDKRVKNKIKAIINADGPGFDKSVTSSKSYKEILSRIDTYIPQSSVIGILLEHEDEYQVVQSTQRGIMQHDIFSWQINRTNLVRLPELTTNSQMLDKAVKIWFENTTPERRENFINIIYEVITASEAQDFNDFEVDTFKKIAKILKSYNNIEKEDKKEIEEMLKLLFQSTLDSIKANKERIG